MFDKKVTYPQYRKYANEKSYFKIISESKFEEIQVFGNKITLHRFEAKILPDRNYIYDLTFNYSDYWLICNENEYKSLREKSIHS
jgi:hypothetical protein